MIRSVHRNCDLDALKHNLSVIRDYAPNSLVLAVVKANAYGHGAITVAQVLKEVDGFGVSSLGEALELRQAGVRHKIVVLGGVSHRDELTAAIDHQLDLVLHQPYQITLLQQLNTNTPIHVWLKIDTGMHRLGFLAHEVETAWHALQGLDSVRSITLMTHFAKADEVNDKYTLEQITAFNQITQHIPGARSLANSAGVMAWPDAHADWVRPGIMLYGVSPFVDKTGPELGLQPVMTFKAELSAIRDFPKGTLIGYGGVTKLKRNSRVGVVNVGYGDGYPWHAKPGTPVLVNGVACPLLGRVSMDRISIDLSDCEYVNIGAEVTLWGCDLPVEVIAKHADTIPYELLC